MDFDRTRYFVKANPDITITTSDKGYVTVIISKLDYETKMESLVSETLVYKCLKKIQRINFMPGTINS